MFVFQPATIYNRVVIIGTGGTGGRLVPLAAQFLKTCSHIPKPEMILFDDDIVEQKNLLRQNFIKPDVGQNKAEVLAYRYSNAFDIPIQAHKIRITANSSQNKIVTDAFLGNTIIVICVDSAQARRDIMRTLRNMMGNFNMMPFVIDCGNEDTYGQVRWHTMCSIHADRSDWNREAIRENWMKSTVMGAGSVSSIPVSEEFYYQNTDRVSASCADLDQTLAINAMMATTAMAAIQKLCYLQTFNITGIRIGLDGASAMPFDMKHVADCIQPRDNPADGSYRLGSLTRSISLAGFDSARRKVNSEMREMLDRMNREAEQAKLDAEMAEVARLAKEAADKALALTETSLTDTPPLAETVSTVDLATGETTTTTRPARRRQGPAQDVLVEVPAVEGPVAMPEVLSDAFANIEGVPDAAAMPAWPANLPPVAPVPPAQPLPPPLAATPVEAGPVAPPLMETDEDEVGTADDEDDLPF